MRITTDSGTPRLFERDERRSLTEYETASAEAQRRRQSRKSAAETA